MQSDFGPLKDEDLVSTPSELGNSAERLADFVDRPIIKRSNRTLAWRRLVFWSWRQRWFYLLCQFATLGVLVWWIPYRHLPWTGTGVAIIAFLAALMSIHRNIRSRDKFVYLALMALLLVLEFRSMKKDRQENKQESIAAQEKLEVTENHRLTNLLSGERDNTAKLLHQENKSFAAVLRQDQHQYLSSLSAMAAAHKKDERDFADVVSKEENLLTEQRNLSEQLDGRLVPGDQPTPHNACSGDTYRGDPSKVVTVIVGKTAFRTDRLLIPDTILQVAETKVISLDRVADSNDLSLQLNFTDSRNRILLRLDKNGAVNRAQGLILLRPDRSTFLVEDAYGREFLKATYLNSSAFEISGYGVYCGKVFPIASPSTHILVSGLCIDQSSHGILIQDATCVSR